MCKSVRLRRRPEVEVNVLMKWIRHWPSRLALYAAVLVLAACSSAGKKPEPVPYPPNPGLVGVRLAWQMQLGAPSGSLRPAVHAPYLTLADSAGNIVRLDALSGAQQWRTALNTPLSAGVGSDGRFAAVVSKANELIVLDEGREIWRGKLGAQVLTAPLVAGQRVFVLDADRNLSAFDARTGRRLWQVQRRGEALVLRQAGLLMAVGNTLVMGVSGHVLGVNPANGSLLWDVTVATTRGTNEIERLVDVVDGVVRVGNTICVRAFQAAVACLDAQGGKLAWSQPANGYVGLSGDDKQVFGAEEDGRLRSWQTADGKAIWQSDLLRFRQLSGPLLVGRSIVVGDDSGNVHLLSREDGGVMNRMPTDGSALASAPVLVANTMVVMTSKGAVFGFRPD